MPRLIVILLYLVRPPTNKLGMLKILELRERVQQVIGDDFDIRGFQDVVLDGRALPLDILDRGVHNYIDESLQI